MTILSQFAAAVAESEIANTVEYEPNDLQILAIFFTLIKCLIQVNPIPQSTFPRTHGKDVVSNLLKMISLIELLRVACKDMHLTLVRNEQAYYNLISQLLPHIIIATRKKFTEKVKSSAAYNYHKLHLSESKKEFSYFTSMEDSLQKVYVFGHSHALFLAWHLCSDLL